MGRFTDALRDEVSLQQPTEWTGTLGKSTVTLFARPLAPIDTDKIARQHPDFVRSPSLAGMVDLLILKCVDDRDEKAFDKGDRMFLMRTGSNKIGEIFHALFGSQITEETEEDFEERVKN